MTKLKKLLLTLAPISAVMIATPIILTSCSTNAEQNNGGSQGGGNGSGGGSDTGGGSGSGGNGSGGENNSQNPNLTADATNSKDFKPTTDKGLFNAIEASIKAGKKGEETKQIDAALTAFATPLTDADVKDAINVWSFNKWYGVDNKVQYVSNIENPIAIKNDKTKPTTWDISFTYKFKVITTNESKKEDIYGERTFEVKGIDLASKKGVVDFNTKASKFMVDGKDMLKDSATLYDAKADATESEPVKKVKEFLTAATSNFDIRAVAGQFATNKGIVGEKVTPVPAWAGQTSDKAAVVSADKKTMTVTLPDSWNGNIKKGATQAQIKTQLETADSKKFILTYVSDADGWNVTFDNGTLNATAKTSTFKMTLTKEGETNVELNLVFKDVTKDK